MQDLVIDHTYDAIPSDLSHEEIQSAQEQLNLGGKLLLYDVSHIAQIIYEAVTSLTFKKTLEIKTVEEKEFSLQVT